MDGTNGLRESTLGVNAFTAPGKAMVGERPKPFGEALGFDPITSTLIFGEYDAVLVDAMTTVAEAEALADWIALHNRNLDTIYITHAHFGHFYGPGILLDRFPGARAIATPKAINAMQMSFTPLVERLGELVNVPSAPSLSSECATAGRVTDLGSDGVARPCRKQTRFHRGEQK